MKTRAFRKPSIKDVALRAGVSPTTVSFVMNGSTNMCAPETAERVRAAIQELQYIPNSLSSSLRRGTTRTIGVCLLSPLDPEVVFGKSFFKRAWDGIVEETDAEDYSLLHYPRSVRVGTEAGPFLDGRVDGIIFHGGHGSTRPEIVAQAGMPVVLLTKSSALPETAGAVYADEQDTIRRALDHLRALGHRRIAHLAGPIGSHPGHTTESKPVDIAVLRLNAYITQQQEAGDYDPALIGYADAWQIGPEKATGVVAAWRCLADPPTAVVCANDALAVAVLNAALAVGWSVPDRVSIVGVDDSPEARQAVVPITSVDVPIEEIGREGIRSLLRLMDGAPVESCRVAVPVTRLVVRDSTAWCCRPTPGSSAPSRVRTS